MYCFFKKYVFFYFFRISVSTSHNLITCQQHVIAPVLHQVILSQKDHKIYSIKISIEIFNNLKMYKNIESSLPMAAFLIFRMVIPSNVLVVNFKIRPFWLIFPCIMYVPDMIFVNTSRNSEIYPKRTCDSRHFRSKTIKFYHFYS